MPGPNQLRKRKPPKKALFSVENTLLVGFLGLMGAGALQGGAVTMASNTAPTPGASQIAARPDTDYTPVGSIDDTLLTTDPGDDARKTVTIPFGLRGHK